MARHYGTIATGIWDDEDFRALSPEAQRLYVMLITQSGITPAGTLAITLRKWASYSHGTDIEGTSMALTELADALFVALDWDREELLVRSFIRWDHGYTNAKRLIAIKSDAKAVRSGLLSGVLSFELSRLGIDHDILTPPIDVASMGDRCGIDARRSVVTLVSTFPTHTPHSESTLREPQHTDVPSDAGKPAPRATRATRIPEDFTITDQLQSWAAETVPNLDIEYATKKFVLHFQAASGARATMISWDAAWKKWMLNEYKPGPNTRGNRNGLATDGKGVTRNAKGVPVAGRNWEAY